jgi:transposase InsO family protein
VIDHFSRKIISVVPLEGPNAVWVVEALTKPFEGYGTPRHLITDREPVFRSSAFADLLERGSVKHRLGAIGKHGSIAVTERAIKTLRYEWLHRVPIIKRYDHLAHLCQSFEEWYNRWGPHMTLEGARPEDIFAGKEPVHPPRDAKRIPPRIERRVFAEARTTAYRLGKAA